MKSKIKEGPSDFHLIIRDHLLENYEPVTDPTKAEFHLTTLEVYNQLQKLLPEKESFKPADVAAWLHSAGFKFKDFGYLQLEWMFKNRIVDI